MTVTHLAIAFLIVCVVVLLPFLFVNWVTPTVSSPVPVEGERFEALPDGRIRYDEAGGRGDSTTLLFLHGFNGQLDAWTGAWSRMDHCGHRVRIDLPGFGGSSRDANGDYSLPTQARRVIAFLDARGIRSVTLVGTSMGGSLAAWIAAHYPERVVRMVLLAPSGYTGALRRAGLFGLILRPGPLNTMAQRVAQSALYRQVFPHSAAPQALSVTSLYGPQWVRALASVHTPTLIVWSRGDFGISHTTAAEVRAVVRNSELLWLDVDTGHLIPEQRPALTAALACSLAAGAPPDEAVNRLAPGLLRPDEGLAR